MLQSNKIMWDDNLVIQRLSDNMEFAVTYSILDVYFAEELWISRVPGASVLHRPQTLPGGYLKLNTRFNTPFTISKRCKVIGRSQRDCILEWARLHPEKISSFLDSWRMILSGRLCSGGCTTVSVYYILGFLMKRPG